MNNQDTRAIQNMTLEQTNKLIFKAIKIKVNLNELIRKEKALSDLIDADNEAWRLASQQNKGTLTICQRMDKRIARKAIMLTKMDALYSEYMALAKIISVSVGSNWDFMGDFKMSQEMIELLREDLRKKRRHRDITDD